MVDVEPFLEAPFEEASNLSFEVLLGIGVALLAAVAVLGRSTVTTAAVAVYLLSIPGYVGYRIRVWEGGDDVDGSESDTDADDSDDEADSDDETGTDDAGNGSDGDDGEREASDSAGDTGV